MTRHYVTVPTPHGVRHIHSWPHGTGIGYQGAMHYAAGRRDADVVDGRYGNIVAQRRDGEWVVDCGATPLETE